jgi:hypothetical protein
VNIDRQCRYSFPQSPSQSAASQTMLARSFVQPLAILLTLLVTASAWAQISPAPRTFSGMMVSDGGQYTVTDSAGDFPGVGSNAALPFGVYRIWDTSADPSSADGAAALAWPGMQSATGLIPAGVDALKLELTNLHISNPNAVAWYTLSRTPYWATSNQTDTSCNYYNAGNWNGGTGSVLYAPGQCDLPSDLTTANGSGVYTDQTWINWVTELATELHSLSSGYAQVEYFEIWNEFDRSNSLTGETNGNVSYEGNYRELLRMTEDARCILLGGGTGGQPTIHNYNTSGGTETCNTTNFPGGVGIMPGVKIVTPSAHAQGTQQQINQGTELMQNFLYCNVPITDEFPPPSDCNWATSNWGANAVDVINFHMKPGNEPPPGGATNQQPEAEMTNELAAATVFLETREKGLPFWNGEAGYSGNGWNGGTNCNPLCIDLATAGPGGGAAPGEEAAFVARYALIQWALGISGYNWYQFDGQTGVSNILSTGTAGSLTLTDPGQAYYNVTNWIEGSSMTSNCANAGNPVHTTLWSCQITKSIPTGWQGRVYWDVGSLYACLGADPTPCSGATYSLTVPATYVYYQTAIGTGQNAIASNKINVSSMPTLVETAKFVERGTIN